MTKFWAYSEIRDKVERDLDLQSETFIPPAEMLGYVNEAINEAEAEIHTLYEDYFLNSAPITVTSGTSEYDLPSDIYAHKIRDIVYNNAGQVWRLKRMRDWHKIIQYSEDQIYASGQVTEYFIKNATAGQPQILLNPPNRENGILLTIWYLRNANEMVLDTDLCDIPEFISFVIAYTKYKCMMKEGHPSTQSQIADLEHQRQLMQATLSGMVPDSDNEIEGDYTHYQEHS